MSDLARLGFRRGRLLPLRLRSALLLRCELRSSDPARHSLRRSCILSLCCRSALLLRRELGLSDLARLGFRRGRLLPLRCRSTLLLRCELRSSDPARHSLNRSCILSLCCRSTLLLRREFGLIDLARRRGIGVIYVALRSVAGDARRECACHAYVIARHAETRSDARCEIVPRAVVERVDGHRAQRRVERDAVRGDIGRLTVCVNRRGVDRADRHRGARRRRILFTGALPHARPLPPRSAVGGGAAAALRGEAGVVFDRLAGGGHGVTGGGLRHPTWRRRRAGRAGLHHDGPHEDAVSRRALKVRNALSTEISINVIHIYRQTT